MHHNSPTNNAEFKNFPGDNTPDPRFRGEENLFSFSKMYQNYPIAMQNSKIFPGTIQRTFVLGERKVGFISPKMYKHAPTAMQNSKKFQNSRTLVFGRERGKLPPLEIMSGYATDWLTVVTDWQLFFKHFEHGPKQPMCTAPVFRRQISPLLKTTCMSCDWVMWLADRPSDWLMTDWLVTDWLVTDWLVTDWLVTDCLVTDSWLTDSWLTRDWLVTDWLVTDWLVTGWLMTDWLITD